MVFVGLQVLLLQIDQAGLAQFVLKIDDLHLCLELF
jgi:hypothetical protein